VRLVSYMTQTGPTVGGLRDDGCVNLSAVDPRVPGDMRTLLTMGAAGLDLAREALQTGEPEPLDESTILPIVPNPEKILCIGLNYADHAAETGKPLPDVPVVFNKAPTALSAHGRKIVLPRVSQEVDAEAELTVVIGTAGRYIAEEDALSHVAGYTCGNDVSARDWQIRRAGGQWFLGKSFDTFAPVGPYLVTADEIPDPSGLRVRSIINGQTMQDSTTDQFIFTVARLIAEISQVCTLTPGDLILTGTPPGVGMARKPPVFLQPGDVVEIDIEKVGTLRNEVAAEL